MQEGKKCIADGPIETRDNLHGFKTEYNRTHPKDRLKTLAEAIDKLIEIAGKMDYYKERIESLESEINGFEDKHKKNIGKILTSCEEINAEKDKRIKELEDEIERIELQHEVDMTEYDIGEDE